MLYIEKNNYQYMNYHIYTLDDSYNTKYSHIHDLLEISLILEGSGKYIIGAQEYLASTGDVFIINGKTIHKLNIDKNSTIKNMVFHFDPSFFWDGSHSNINKNYLSSFNNQNINFSHKLSKNQAITSKIAPLLEQCSEEFINQSKDYALMIKSLFMTIMVLLNRHYYKLGQLALENKNNLNFYRMEKIIDYIDQHYSDTIKLEELACIAHLEPSYFTKVFKAVNGLSPINYIQHIRIKHSEKFLTDNTLTLEQISWKCGFKSYSHFVKVFKKLKGMNPSSYRNNY